MARSVARTVLISATVGAALAALAYAGHGWGDLSDSVLEIGGASFPLLLIPFGGRQAEDAHAPVFIARSTITIVLAASIYALFIGTLGRGVVT